MILLNILFIISNILCVYSTRSKPLLTFYDLHKKQLGKNLRNAMYLFLIISIVSFLTLIGIVIAYYNLFSGAGESSSITKVLFPLAEIVFFISFLASIIICYYFVKEAPKTIKPLKNKL